MFIVFEKYFTFEIIWNLLSNRVFPTRFFYRFSPSDIHSQVKIVKQTWKCARSFNTTEIFLQIHFQQVVPNRSWFDTQKAGNFPHFLPTEVILL